MKKQMSFKKWTVSAIAALLALVLLLMGLMYALDPFFQFRVRDNSYMLNPRYVNPGLIKNHDYDSILIGSSMAQNFDMDIFRQELGGKPLKIAIGGLTALETAEYMELAHSVGKAERYYVCLDLHSYTQAAS